jgi:formate C-acetyltransferase
LEFSNTVKETDKKENLIRLATALKTIPEFPAESFYEAVLSLYFIYGYIPDSIGLIDRYLYPYFKSDIDGGILTVSEAKDYLQELFLMLQARIHIDSDRFYRGGESHFCIGGYTKEGKDGFNELSRLIVESLLELPTWIPQISLRWTKKTPREVLRFMLDAERRDANKRIAFVNDEPRIKGLMEYSGFEYSEAVGYTMMGCNELAMPGGMVMGFDPFNISHSVDSTLYARRGDILKSQSFEDFFAIYREELLRDLDEANEIGRGFQAIRNRDTCIVSNIFIDGCIENAKSITKDGGDKFIAVGLPIGITTVVDSLTVIKQFVFDEKFIDMSELCRALDANWKGHEELRQTILKRARFFGNDEAISGDLAKAVLAILKEWNTGDNYLGKKWLFGNLIGYNEHHKFFGAGLGATPDGRHAGEAISFGIGQTGGKDRNGLTALLNSISTCDPNAILTGPSVTNVAIDEKLIRDDESFERLVSLFETYFKNGGTHFQLTYVSKEDLIRAKKTPDEYKHLRVRVSGFSDYFVNLNSELQDDVIQRTEHVR